MAEFVMPPLLNDGEWPSLGPQVGDWMEANLAFGPGDLLGKPYVLDDEDRALLERSYQVFPKGHPREGRRRFDTVVFMLRKGSKKSERLAAVAAAELAGDAPVRCDGFHKVGRRWEPVGRPVVSPFVFILAFAKEQAEDTSFDALRQMILLGPGRDRFDVWEEKILRRDGTGEAKALATAPDSRDGGKTTFQGKEEGHRWTLPRQREAHQTTRGNLSKRPIAEPWEMHATTMYSPGEGSIIEELHDAARKLQGDAAKQSRLFFFYRWADTRIKIRNEDGTFNKENLRAAINDASGPITAKWSDPDGIASLQFLAPGADPNYAERVWLNRPLRRTAIAFDAQSWKRNARPQQKIPAGALVVGSFDGSRGTDDPKRSPDHTGIIVTEIATGFQTKFAHWDPDEYPGRHIPRDQVDIAVDDFFTNYDVVLFYPDPPEWDSEIAVWIAKYGKERVRPWATWRERPIGFACQNYAKAIETGEVIHDGDPVFAAHIGNAHRRFVNARDDKNERLWTIQKEREGSQLKIDLAMCGVLSWEARSDAIAGGALIGEPDSAYAGMTEEQIVARMLGREPQEPDAEDEDAEDDDADGNEDPDAVRDRKRRKVTDDELYGVTR